MNKVTVVYIGLHLYHVLPIKQRYWGRGSFNTKESKTYYICSIPKAMAKV